MAQTYEVTDSAKVNPNYGNWSTSLPKLKEALVRRGMSADATLRMFEDPRRDRLALEWSNATSAARFREGRITATMRGEIILDLDLDGQKYPPTPDGAFVTRGHLGYGDLEVKLSFSTSPTTSMATDSVKTVSAMLAGKRILP